MNDDDALTALADAVAARILDRVPALKGPFGPTGEPMPQLPEIPGKWVEPPVLPKARLALEGLELTQSTQHYGTGYDDDNAVPLVALKELVVRAYPYVTQGLLAADNLSGQQVTGELVLHQGGKEIYRTGPTRTSARVGPKIELDRELWDRETVIPVSTGGFAMGLKYWNAPLNFNVPAWFLRAGPLTATVSVWLVAAGPFAAVSKTARKEVLDVRAPKIALVRVNWRDASGTVTAPSDADMLATTRLAERMLPFPYFETTILGAERTESGDFSMTASGCNARWSALLTSLEVTRIFTALFQLGDIVFAMLPAAGILTPPGGTIQAGCGDGDKGVGGCFVGREGTFAHEIGHIYDREHVAVAADPDSDPNYPNYGGDKRSIGEVGIDTGQSPPQLFPPRGFDDIMSYGAERWISPYTYRALLDARFMRQSAKANPARVRPYFVVAFRLLRLAQSGHAIEVEGAHRIAAAGSIAKVAGPRARSVSIDFIDRRDRIIVTHHAFASTFRASGCGCGHHGLDDREPRLDFAEAIPWPEDDVARIAFHTGGEPIAVLDAGEPPHVAISEPEIGPDAIEVNIRAEHPKERPSIAVFFSADDGATWTPVAIDPPLDAPLRLDAARLPGGEACRLRVVATAALQPAVAESGPFRLAGGRRALHIRTDEQRCGDGIVGLRALVDTRGFGPVAPDEISWRSDRDGELGRGYDLAARLTPGEHAVAASIPDGRGGILTERAIIVVGG
ncbi:MAG: hypothetical protein AB7O56_11070 [Bauldia sp.]